VVIGIVEAGPTMKSQVLRPTSSYQFELKEDWFVETDQVGPEMHEWDPLFFVGAGGFPAIGQAHDREPTLRFRTFDSMVMERLDRYIFRGMTWSTSQRPFADDYQQNRFDNALKASRSWKFMAIQKPVTRAYVADPTGATKFNRPVPAANFSAQPTIPSTVAGEVFTGLTETEYISVCTYTRNELNPPATLVTGPMIGSVNSDDIFIAW